MISRHRLRLLGAIVGSVLLLAAVGPAGSAAGQGRAAHATPSAKHARTAVAVPHCRHRIDLTPSSL
jgi:hypothetical protein